MADKAENKTQARHRATEVGRVVSRSGNKTIVVQVTRRVQHSLYERYLHRRRNFHAHDEKNQCQVGDWVRIVETRPMSRLKRWRLEAVIAQGALPPPPPAAELSAEAS
jgi:small subunit ribosomal protein S17